MRTIVCSCETSFEADVPDFVDIDANPAQKEAILAGSFMSFKCPDCGRILKPEFPVTVAMPESGVVLYALPELDKPDLADIEKKVDNVSFVVGYPELADRVAVITAGLEPLAIETLKYYLLQKAEETNPLADASVWFADCSAETINFHVYSLKEGETAVSRIPRRLYERTVAECQAHPEAEPFSLIKKGRYISVQNTFTRDL